jgi:superfamily II DNA/RNA helicase
MTEQVTVSLKTEEFKKLGLGKEMMKVVEELGFEKPSAIQTKTIPLVLAGRDVIGNSATGSGKTLAFGTAIIEKSEKGKGIQSLVLTPTRELAIQVAGNLKKFSGRKGLKVQEIYGGVGMSGQVDGLKRSEIVVGTPGRILDHLRNGTLKLGKVKVLVLDEADRMVDMGFLPDVEEIIKQNPKDRQTLLFSATTTVDVNYISGKYMRNPQTISVESFVDPKKLIQHFYDVDHSMKFSLLLHLLKNDVSKLVMVFCNTRRGCDFVARNLGKNGLDAVAIHGGLTQSRRESIMKKFHSGKLMILVCTDIAARGLHIDNVSHVYNYDIPDSSQDYIHRIGRTARAGESGDAISIVSSRDYKAFNDVQTEEALKIERKELPEFEKVYAGFGQNEKRGRGDSRGGYDRKFSGRKFGEGNGGERREGNSGRRDFSKRNSGEKGRSGFHTGGSNRGGGYSQSGPGRSRGSSNFGRRDISRPAGGNTKRSFGGGRNGGGYGRSGGSSGGGFKSGGYGRSGGSSGGGFKSGGYGRSGGSSGGGFNRVKRDSGSTGRHGYGGGGRDRKSYDGKKGGSGNNGRRDSGKRYDSRNKKRY